MTIDTEGAASEFLITSSLQAAPGRQTELVDLLRQLATAMHAEPGCLHYSLHRSAGDESGPLTVVQVYSSREAFQEHASWMRPHLAELTTLLAAPPSAPELPEPVVLSGHERERFGG